MNFVSKVSQIKIYSLAMFKVYSQMPHGRISYMDREAKYTQCRFRNTHVMACFILGYFVTLIFEYKSCMITTLVHVVANILYGFDRLIQHDIDMCQKCERTGLYATIHQLCRSTPLILTIKPLTAGDLQRYWYWDSLDKGRG